ncbi:MAG: MMPL family transporter [Planctomycetes bacterium]|nr:MMPL family transporter [Planctomycetota bacterium]
MAVPPKPVAHGDRHACPYLILSLATLVTLAAAAPWIARSAIAVLSVDATTPIEWVPATFPPRLAYDRFTAEFESGDVIVASWPGCTLGSPAIDRFLAVATGSTAPCDAAGRPWFEGIATGQTALARLTEPPLALDRALALERLRGVLIGPDGVTTCLVIPFTRAGLADRRNAVAWIRDVLLKTATPQEADLHLAGPVIDNVAVDAASTGSLNTFGGPAAALILALTWWSLRSFRYALLVFILALACVGLSFTFIHAWGDRMNPVLIVMPLLVLTLGVSGGIHLVNYLVDAHEHGPRRGIARRAIRVGWLPCALSAGTTAVGLFSLLVSELEPIRVFGFHAALGVLTTLAILFLVLPGIFERWPIRRRIERKEAAAQADAPLATQVTRRAGLIVVLAGFAMFCAGAGVPRIRTSVAIDTLFTRESRVIRDYAWLEQAIGPLVPVEVVLRFTPESSVRPAERLDLVREVGDVVGTLPGVTGVLSAATFLPDEPAGSGIRAAARKAIVARKLEQGLAGLVDMRIVREVAGEQLWRVTARTSALSGLDYGEFLEEVRRRVDPLIAAHDGAARGLTGEYTGVMPLVNAIQKTLLHDLFSSFLSACLVITGVMMAAERGVGAGLVAMIPNVFPMILLFGLLGWTRLPLDIGSVMTASIALGMAVDGTFHFLTFFRRGSAIAPESGAATDGQRAAAVQSAFRHSAAALAESAIVCGLGILVFAGSSFAPSRRFAWMLSLLVAAALVGDLVVLPALLASPLGRFFRSASRSRP